MLPKEVLVKTTEAAIADQISGVYLRAEVIIEEESPEKQVIQKEKVTAVPITIKAEEQFKNPAAETDNEVEKVSLKVQRDQAVRLRGILKRVPAGPKGRK